MINSIYQYIAQIDLVIQHARKLIINQYVKLYLSICT